MYIIKCRQKYTLKNDGIKMMQTLIKNIILFINVTKNDFFPSLQWVVFCTPEVCAHNFGGHWLTELCFV